MRVGEGKEHSGELEGVKNIQTWRTDS